MRITHMCVYVYIYIYIYIATIIRIINHSQAAGGAAAAQDSAEPLRRGRPGSQGHHC